MTPILQITDGTDTVNLIATRNGFGLVDWTPSRPPLKGGGTFVSPPTGDGRRLVFYNYENAVETFSLRINGYNQDAAIFQAQKLVRLLEKARAYWVTDWQREPVYLVARGSGETNTRYSIIHDWSAPNDDNPYAQPFYNCPDVLLDGFTLIIERGHWLADVPGSPSCVPVSDAHPYCTPFSIEFTPNENAIIIADDSALQDLPAEATGFTAEIWVRINEGASQCHLFSKWNELSSGWQLYYVGSGGVGIRARVWAVTQEAESSATLGSFTADGEWHHIVMQYRDTTTRQITILIDGVEVTYSGAQQAAIGAYQSDVGTDLIIGALNGTPIQTVDGTIGWSRVSSAILYTSPFSPPPRCDIPNRNDVVVPGIWIPLIGSGNIITDLTTNNNDGDMDVGASEPGTWVCDCDHLQGHVEVTTNPDGSYTVTDDPTCEREVFVTNHRKQAQINYFFYIDQSIGEWSDNLALAAPPFQIFPSTIEAGDFIYVGISADWENGGPFSSLVFDIVNALGAGHDIDWLYWNGSTFAALNVRDNTSGFTVEGVNSVHWEPPSDWEPVTLSPGGYSVNGWWLKIYVNSVTGTPSPPSQQNRFIYTLSWNYITVEDEQLGGDIPAIARLTLYNRSSLPTTERLDFARVICGLRSRSRGDDFSSYLLASESQNPLGIVCADYTSGSFIADGSAVGGEYLKWSSSSVEEDNLFGYFFFPSTALLEYYGKFRMYVLGEHSSDNTRIRVGLYTGANADAFASLKWKTDLLSMETDELSGIADCGIISLPPIQAMRDDDAFNGLRIGFFGTNNDDSVQTINIYGLVLMPVDEWSGDFFQYITDDAGESIGLGEYLDIDSARFPRVDLRSFSRGVTDNIKQRFVPASNGKFILQANADQRLHFLMFGTTNKGDLPLTPHHAISASFQLYASTRYLSMRGNR